MSDSSTPPIRTLLVDDHPVVRFGVKHMLDAEEDIEVVGELDGMKGIEDALSTLEPDVVLLDLELGEIKAYAKNNALIIQDIAVAAHESGWALRELRQEPGRLDEVFRNVTRAEDAA